MCAQAASNRPLEGVRVLDLTRVIAGPYCTMMLADMGADVAKVEEPLHGDELRWVGRYRGRAAHDEDYFYASNRGKRSVGLNLKDPQEREIARALAQTADVLVENFSPGVAERLGMGWEALHALNPRLVYCSISGFGQTGPARNRLALDPIIQAVSGVMSVTGEPDGPPTQVGAPLGDVVSGMFAAYAIATGLLEARRSGEGRYIDISMQDSMLAVLGPRMGEALQAGISPARYGNQNPMRVPANAYETADGRYVAVIVQNDNHWLAFCTAIERADLHHDARFRTMASRVHHRAEIDTTVADTFRTRSAAQWQARLEAHRVPYGYVNDYLDAVRDEQVAHRGLIRPAEHPVSGPIQVVGPPWMDAEAGSAVRSPPLLGQHTAEVITQWLAWSASEAAKLQEKHEKLRSAA
jgi:crotonobetainyl-CoA:carnitine CoA-transferase CaiB-like acyl-CoA transferase